MLKSCGVCILCFYFEFKQALYVFHLEMMRFSLELENLILKKIFFNISARKLSTRKSRKQNVGILVSVVVSSSDVVSYILL